MQALRSPEPAQAADRAGLISLLQTVQLPTEDLPPSLEHFLVAKEGESVVGSVGLERYEHIGLLRSLAVHPDQQGSGLGQALYEAALRHASAHGITDLYLITTTAAPYFARRGFREIARDQVPMAIRHTAQFTGVCPSTATVMRKES
ncbi:amino-acid N-acetyltransferase [Catalinimonas alkaloidigena]|uniref:Amino-acid N-acetyltransferase n=1 Tax=Catalinimonas alkaloidigena TaxID=1075417 RepID=A0A1G9RAF5_9BACT|nr:arsenic resistance N-acetyltransferase ArsN2 [Catalinimonas alkaloidigena]SDM19385.1 amino-acid N-acetyltransferase [Catalinimonas alkaloidigena]